MTDSSAENMAWLSSHLNLALALQSSGYNAQLEKKQAENIAGESGLIEVSHVNMDSELYQIDDEGSLIAGFYGNQVQSPELIEFFGEYLPVFEDRFLQLTQPQAAYDHIPQESTSYGQLENVSLEDQMIQVNLLQYLNECSKEFEAKETPVDYSNF